MSTRMRNPSRSNDPGLEPLIRLQDTDGSGYRQFQQGIVGDWTRERILGAGGEGQAILYKHKDGSHAVGKVISLPWILADEVPADQRIYREVEILNRLNISRIPGHLQIISIPEDGKLVAFREYVEGPSLSEYISDKGALDEDEVREILKSTSEVLMQVHENDIIHRDIKPANLIKSEGGIWVLDFGLAKDSANPFTSVHSDLHSHKGTTSYMPPEQYLGQVFPASDLFALGITATELLYGRLLPEHSYGYLPPEVLSTFDLPAQGTELGADVEVSPELRQIIKRLIARDRKARYRNAGELYDALGGVGWTSKEQVQLQLADKATLAAYDSLGKYTGTAEEREGISELEDFLLQGKSKLTTRKIGAFPNSRMGPSGDKIELNLDAAIYLQRRASGEGRPDLERKLVSMIEVPYANFMQRAKQLRKDMNNLTDSPSEHVKYNQFFSAEMKFMAGFLGGALGFGIELAAGFQPGPSTLILAAAFPTWLHIRKSHVYSNKKQVGQIAYRDFKDSLEKFYESARTLKTAIGDHRHIVSGHEPQMTRVKHTIASLQTIIDNPLNADAFLKNVSGEYKTPSTE